jgi:hypothetical protein
LSSEKGGGKNLNIIKLLPRNKNWTEREMTDTIIVHHADAVVCSITDIDDWHYERGFRGGCGYNFLVRKDCKIYEGRPLNIEGTHCTGWNNRAVGVCFEGNFDEEKMSDAQQQAGINLLRWIRGQYKQPLRILRHREANSASTATCPGANFRNIIIFEGSKDDMEKITDVDEALKYLLEIDVITSTEFRKKVCDVVTYEKEFVLNIANKFKEVLG